MTVGIPSLSSFSDRTSWTTYEVCRWKWYIIINLEKGFDDQFVFTQSHAREERIRQEIKRLNSLPSPLRRTGTETSEELDIKNVNKEVLNYNNFI